MSDTVKLKPISSAPKDTPIMLWINDKPCQQPITLNEIEFDIGAAHWCLWPVKNED